ncbi:alpha/beta fold hydrolase [Aestuariibacter salexigens]|uniref:alpha/beta fold hydrolase n=1 Tax=Aestuariibacter salexigens TaxID=226010 RepID=UPI00041818E7|nr:alpha/beta hydrolase [Aestuariibacter salexigens]
MVVIGCLLGIIALTFLPSRRIGWGVFATFERLQRLYCGLKRRVFAYDGCSVVFYDSESDKPVLLLLHGLSADKTAWLSCALFLKQRYRLVIPDLIGHGESSYQQHKRYDTKAYIECCKALLLHLQITQYSVVGNSMGGVVAANLLNDRERDCVKAILVGPAGAKTDLTLHMIEQNFNPFLHHSVKSVFDMFSLTMRRRPPVPPSVLYYIAQHNYVDRADRLQHLFSDFVNLDNIVKDPFTLNSDNVLMIWGEEDCFAPTLDIAAWKELVGGHAKTYPGIGHMTMVECPRKTAADISHFCQ